MNKNFLAVNGMSVKDYNEMIRIFLKTTGQLKEKTCACSPAILQTYFIYFSDIFM